jgi:uncharacterized membrane protein
MVAHPLGMMMTDSRDAAKLQKPKFSPLAMVSGWFAAGLGVVLPFAITIAICWAIVSFIDKTVLPAILPLAPPHAQGLIKALPGAGVVVALVGLTVIGALTANFIGRFVVKTTERVMTTVPLVKGVYSSAKQIVETMTNPDGQSFKEAVLVEFPAKGQWSIAFVTNDNPPEINRAAGETLVALYVPSSPIPTSGFLIYVPRASVKPLDKGPEEALKLVMSAGVVKEVVVEAAATKGA